LDKESNNDYLLNEVSGEKVTPIKRPLGGKGDKGKKGRVAGKGDSRVGIRGNTGTGEYRGNTGTPYLLI
jgi:hypothetical protein